MEDEDFTPSPALKRKAEYPANACAAKGCRRKGDRAGLAPFQGVKKGKPIVFMLCDKCAEGTDHEPCNDLDGTPLEELPAVTGGYEDSRPEASGGVPPAARQEALSSLPAHSATPRFKGRAFEASDAPIVARAVRVLLWVDRPFDGTAVYLTMEADPDGTKPKTSEVSAYFKEQLAAGAWGELPTEGDPVTSTDISELFKALEAGNMTVDDILAEAPALPGIVGEFVAPAVQMEIVEVDLAEVPGDEPIMPGATLVVTEEAETQLESVALAPVDEEAAKLKLTYVQELEEMLSGHDVENTVEGLNLSGGILSAVIEERQEWEAQRTEITGPLNESLKKINSLFKPARDAYDAVISRLRSKIILARARAESVAEEALEELAAAYNAGDEEAVSIALAKRGAIMPAASDDIPGLRFSSHWDIEIEDLSAVPPEYLIVDKSKILAHVRKTKGSEPIPGIRHFAYPRVAKAPKKK